MRILLVAYDFPPLASPQAIRWYYLTRELAKQRVDVHVLAPAFPEASGASLPAPEGVTIHRCDPGGLAGWIARRRRVRRPRPASGGEQEAPVSPGSTKLNWKGRLYHRLDRLIGFYCYPDSRAQWYGPARSRLEGLLAELAPDVLITSHEPPVSLQLALDLVGRTPWLADLGDPVLAPYTPARWRRRAFDLERKTCERAVVSVTTERARRVLIERHGIDPSRIWVLTQGFDDRMLATDERLRRPQRKNLRLFYAGRFYPFRSPEALLEAVCAVPGIDLTIAAPEVEARYLAMADRSSGRIAFLGEQPHAAVLRMQRECDVLINIGNALEAQIPGKLYEYLGSGTPVLHLSSSADDPVPAMLDEMGAGWSCPNRTDSLEEFLMRLRSDFDRMRSELALDPALVREFGWSSLAERLARRCREAAGIPEGV